MSSAPRWRRWWPPPSRAGPVGTWAGLREGAWTTRRVPGWAGEEPKKRGSSTPRLDAELLLGKVLDLPRVKPVIDAERPLPREELATYRELPRRRRKGEP